MATSCVPEDWITPQAAAAETGFRDETVLTWTRGSTPAVRRRSAGGRAVLVARDDVLRKAASTKPRARRSTARTPTKSYADSATLDRLATLEEIARQHRMIDQHRAEIARQQEAIIDRYRDVEALLLAPTGVPADLEVLPTAT